MGDEVKKRLSGYCLYLAVLVLAVELAACVADRGLVAAAAFDPRDYSDVEIVVLPVTIAPSIQHAVPLDQVLKGVIAAIEHGARLRIREVTEAELGDRTAEFPLTTAFLQQVSIKLDKPVIGISIPAVAVDSNGEMKLDTVAMFADRIDKHRRWVVSGTLKTHTSSMADDVEEQLTLLFGDLHRLTTAGLRPLFAETSSPAGPMLTFFSPSTALPPEGPIFTDAKSISLVVSAIDDESIVKLWVANRTTGYEWDWASAADGASRTYVTAPMEVPLASGKNRIAITATNASSPPESRTREFIVASTSTRGPVLFAVGIEHNTQKRPANGADEAVDTIATAVGRLPGHTIGILKDEDVTRSALYDRAYSIAGSIGPGDQPIFYFAGRVSTSSGRPNLILTGSKTKDRLGISENLLLSEIRAVVDPGGGLILLDLCQDSADIDATRASLEASPLLSQPRVLVSLTDCESGSIGQLATGLASWTDHASTKQRRKITSDTLFADLLPTVSTLVTPGSLSNVNENLTAMDKRQSYFPGGAGDVQSVTAVTIFPPSDYILASGEPPCTASTESSLPLLTKQIADLSPGAVAVALNANAVPPPSGIVSKVGGVVSGLFRSQTDPGRATCGLVAAVIPDNAQVREVHYYASDQENGERPCSLNLDCDVGWAKFLPATITKVGDHQLIAAEFRNWSSDRLRKAKIVVFYSVSAKFYVVVATTGSRDQALAQASLLIARNYKPALISTLSGVYAVALGDAVSSRELAADLLSTAQKQGDAPADAYILTDDRIKAVNPL